MCLFNPFFRMADWTTFLSKMTPFLSNYWQYVTAGAITVLLAVLVAYWLSSSDQNQNQQKKSKKDKENKMMEQKRKKKNEIGSFDKGEHPLEEFDDEKPDPSLAPPLHSPDTPHIPYKLERFSEADMKVRAATFYEFLNQRRSVRDFSKDPIPIEVIESIIRAAGTSPSGAHSEPWTFVVVKDPKVKSQIREIVEQEEYLNYDRRMGDKWVNNLKFIHTTHEKPYLEEAPYIILVFKQMYHIGEDGVHYAHYYYEISTAIACGILLTAIHNAGLVTVTTTPLNAGVALRELLGRPDNEKVMLLLPVGYPAEDAKVPDVKRKPLEQII